jgi:hypothetical protein
MSGCSDNHTMSPGCSQVVVICLCHQQMAASSSMASFVQGMHFIYQRHKKQETMQPQDLLPLE